MNRIGFVAVLAVIISIVPVSMALGTNSESQTSLQFLAEQSRQVLLRNSQPARIQGLGTRPVLFAGSAKFASLWTRDFAFAALGAMSLSQVDAVRGSLEALFLYQREDGLIPRRIGSQSNVWKGLSDKLGLPSRKNGLLKRPEYRSGLGGVPIDSIPLVAWVMEEYVRHTGDLEFAKTYWPNLLRGFEWLQLQESESLLVQTPYGDWKDVTARKGVVLYTNAVYLRGLQAMADLAHSLGEAGAEAHFLDSWGSTRTVLLSRFWNPDLGYFVDYLGDSSGRFSADGNFLLVWFGIARRDQADRILRQADLKLMDFKLGLYRNIDRSYPRAFVPFSVRFVGIRGYADNSFVYPWNTSLYALAALSLPNTENLERANRALRSLAVVVRRDGFQEAYEPGGRPVCRWAHKSEPDFSWFAGLTALAIKRAADILE